MNSIASASINSAVSVGTVAAIWRFPVKSMLGERLEGSPVTDKGLPGDRGYALLDVEKKRIANAVDFRRYPNFFAFKARYLEAPDAGGPLPPIVISLPDGGEVRSDARGVHEVISAQMGCQVRLVRTGDEAPRGEAESGPFFDAEPVSVITHSTLRTMNELQSGSDYDARRFRMNLVLECEEAGFPENAWVGKDLNVGGACLRITRPDARCVMTTLAQEDLPADREILRGLLRHNRLQVGEKGRYPCAGVYASVRAQGAVRAGDPVSLA